MSKAEKMRGQLAAMQRDREDYERQKKELEEEMHRGRQNMGKIKKGLREGGIVNEQILVSESVAEPETPNQSRKPSRVSQAKLKGATGEIPLTMANIKESDKIPVPTPFSPDKGASQMSSMIPSGPRISEWCFTGDINSAPPIVKSRDMYENVRLLGRGSFGEVNLVKNVEDNKLFAIKTIFCAKDADMGPVLHEVKFLRLSRHPCIIDIHDAFLMTNPRVVHIVMHYCESGTLASYISNTKKNKGSISEAQIIKWTLQLALALQFLHDVNHTLHRDIKPMNVMLTEGGEIIKLADFGLAMNMDECSVSESIAEAGTPYYTAPEMIKGENYTYPADCWSFGIILHQLLTLERPFEGSSTAALVKSILTEEPPALPVHYSEDIRAISAGLLLKDPIDRISMAQLLSDPFIHGKASSFPNSYRPKTLEERIRRSHVKQLEHQMESLTRSGKTIAQSMKSFIKASPPPLEANNSTTVLTMDNLQAMATVEVSNKNESAAKSTEKAATAILDKISENGSNRDKKKHQYLMQSFASVSDDEETSPSSGKSGRAFFATSNKEDLSVVGQGMLSIMHPNETQQSNRKLTVEESENMANSEGEGAANVNANAVHNAHMADLHGSMKYVPPNVIHYRSASYHGHVNSDEERDAMVTPYMSGKFGGPTAVKSDNNSVVEDGDEDIGFESPVRIEEIKQRSEIFGIAALMEEAADNGIGVMETTKDPSVKRLQSLKAETPQSLSESPNIDSSPMNVGAASATFYNSDRSLSSQESPHSSSGPVNGASMKLTHVASMGAIKEEPSEVAVTVGGGVSVRTSTSDSAKMDAALAPTPLQVDVSGEALAESALTPLPSEKLGQSRKGKELAKAIEADSYYESKLNT